MKYYLKDSFLHNAHEKNAGSKARNDVEAILISERVMRAWSSRLRIGIR